MMITKACPFLFFSLLSAFFIQAQVPGAPIDVQHYNFVVRLSDANDTIKGEATVSVKFLKDISSFRLNLVKTNRAGKGMLVSAVKEGGSRVAFSQDSDAVNVNSPAKKNSVRSYTIIYQGIPADGLIISTNKYGHRTFFGDNWPNRAHNWLPCADDPADKAAVDFVVTAPDHYSVIANGLKVEETKLPGQMKLTHWTETAPLPTKVMVIGAADFAIEEAGEPDHIPVYTYVFPENGLEGFKSYAVAKEILPFYIAKIGPYAYKKLADVQSKTIFGGMENAGAIFYFENSVGSRGIEELMAHEIAHQWFGDAASEKSFAHLWLSEGFATFMTNVYLEHKYGPDTLKKRLADDRATVLKFEQRSLTPVVDSAVTNNFMQLLNANSYQKGGWVLHMLRAKLGDEIFWKGIRNYYARYNGGNAGTDDLRVVMEQASGQNLKVFFTQWLYTAGNPHLQIRWRYDAGKKMVQIQIRQLQDNLFSFPLDIDVAHAPHSVRIEKRDTLVHFAVAGKPSGLAVDPGVNLLAGFDIAESN